MLPVVDSIPCSGNAWRYDIASVEPISGASWGGVNADAGNVRIVGIPSGLKAQDSSSGLAKAPLMSA